MDFSGCSCQETILIRGKLGVQFEFGSRCGWESRPGVHEWDRCDIIPGKESGGTLFRMVPIDQSLRSHKFFMGVESIWSRLNTEFKDWQSAYLVTPYLFKWLWYLNAVAFQLYYTLLFIIGIASVYLSKWRIVLQTDSYHLQNITVTKFPKSYYFYYTSPCSTGVLRPFSGTYLPL